MPSWNLLVFGTTLVFCNCATSYYSWGSYEASLSRMYLENEDFKLNEEIALLADEIKTTLNNNQRVPPGKMAHLGYLFYLAGNHKAAIRCFKAEKRLFPESARFINGMLERMR